MVDIQAGQGLLCVSLAADDASATKAILDRLPIKPDVVEIRLDLMAAPDVRRCCQLLPEPLLFTNRPRWEGGQNPAQDEQRMVPLLHAIQEQAAFIDWELAADADCRSQLLDSLKGGVTRMIISSHDFHTTESPARLLALFERMTESGAHGGKLVTTAREPNDVIRVLSLLEQARRQHFPLTAFCMGQAGIISRLATLYLGGFMSYAAPDEQSATAPGQLSLARLLAARQALNPPLVFPESRLDKQRSKQQNKS